MKSNSIRFSEVSQRIIDDFQQCGMDAHAGIRPTLRHVPPKGPLSTNATFKPWANAPFTIALPAPDPTTITSYSFIVPFQIFLEKCTQRKLLF